VSDPGRVHAGSAQYSAIGAHDSSPNVSLFSKPCAERQASLVSQPIYTVRLETTGNHIHGRSTVAANITCMRSHSGSPSRITDGLPTHPNACAQVYKHRPLRGRTSFSSTAQTSICPSLHTALPVSFRSRCAIHIQGAAYRESRDLPHGRELQP
jgi:hypothetical protein